MFIWLQLAMFILLIYLCLIHLWMEAPAPVKLVIHSVPVLWCALQSHLPIKHWSGLYSPKWTTVTSVLNNTAGWVIAPLGVREEEEAVIEQCRVVTPWECYEYFKYSKKQRNCSFVTHNWNRSHIKQSKQYSVCTVCCVDLCFSSFEWVKRLVKVCDAVWLKSDWMQKQMKQTVLSDWKKLVIFITGW